MRPASDFIYIQLSNSRVSVNGKPAKASLHVKTGDIIEIVFGQKTVKAEVLSLAESTKKEDAKEMFRYL